MKTITSRYGYISIPVTLLFIFSSINLVAQTQEDNSSLVGNWDARTLLKEVLDSNTISALSEAGILKDFSKEAFQEYQDFFSDKTKVPKLGLGKLKLPLPNLYASWDHKYVKNNRAGEEGWTNLGYLNVGSSFNVMGLPFDGSVQAGLLNNKVNWNLSGVNFDFHQRAFLENLAEDKLNQGGGLSTDKFDKIKQSDIKKMFSERLPNPAIPNDPFGDIGVDILKNELKHKLLAFIVNHPKYQELYNAQVVDRQEDIKEKAQGRVDSMSNKRTAYVGQGQARIDSIGQKVQKNKAKAESMREKAKAVSEKDLEKQAKSKAESLVSSAKASAAVSEITTKYKESWNERKTYYGDSLNSFKSKFFAKVSKDQIKKMSKDSLLAIAKSNTNKSGLQNIMQKVNRLNIGRTVVNDHWLLAENLSMNGAMVAYESGNYSFSSGAGVQRYDYSIFPLLGFSIPTQLPDRRFVYASASYEVEDAYAIKISNLNSQEKLNDLTTGSAIERVNNVFLFSGTTRLVGDLRLVFDAAYSRTNGVFVQVPETGTTGDIDKAAGEVKLDYRIPKTNLHVDVGYFYLGSQYITLGNPFIRNGQKGLTFGLTGNVFNRIDFDITARNGASTETNNTEPARKDFVVNGTARMNISKNLSLSASVFPNFTNYQLNEVFDVKSKLWTTSYEIQHNAGSDQYSLINSLSYSNSLNELVLADTAELQNFDGLIYYGNLMFKNGMGIDVLGMGFSDEGIFKEGINSLNVQFNLIYNKKNTRLHAGVIYGQDQSDSDPFSTEKNLGIAAGASFSLFKNINIGVESRLPVYREGKANSQRFIQEYINTKLKFKLQ